MNFLEFVSQKAQACGWSISEVVSESMVSLNFSVEGRAEKVYVRPCGKTADDNTVIEFKSSGLVVPDDETLAHDLGFALLRRNGDMLMGHWGIEEVGGAQYFTIFVTQIANTMDMDEFKGAVNAILGERSRFNKVLQSATIGF